MEPMLNSSTGGWIGDDRKDEADFTSVSQTIAKPHVSGSRKIVKLTSKDGIPLNAKFLYAREEFQGMAGWISNLQPVYKTIFYYEVDSDFR
jgi:trehalose-6-phosphatase